jgi:peptidoglycan/xylan/chitin deacetylase (PgdA/CDA1 family)
LHAQGYTALTVSQLGAATRTLGALLPARPVVITFDDGFADFYSAALPILSAYGLVATLYVPTGFVGQSSGWLGREGESGRALVTWQQLREISAQGIECGTHTHRHLPLDTLPWQVCCQEITLPKVLLEEELGQAVTTFAYPHGYYSQAVREVVQTAGYTSACAVKHAMSSVTDDPWALARIVIDHDTEVNALARLLQGEGLRVAPQKERLRTTVWRLLRRWQARGSHPGMTLAYAAGN